MGHDITIYCPAANPATEWARHDLDNHDDGWLDRHEAYQRATQIAYLRRSAGNPNNAAIYLALGCYDEAYGGCSGYGVTLSFSLDQFYGAREILKSREMVVPDDSHPGNRMFAELLGTLASMPDAKVMMFHGDRDLEPEIEFVERAIEFLEHTDRDELEVEFC